MTRICEKCRHWNDVCTNKFGMNDKEMLRKYGNTKCPNFSRNFTTRWYLYILPFILIAVGTIGDHPFIQVVGIMGGFLPIWLDMQMW